MRKEERETKRLSLSMWQRVIDIENEKKNLKVRILKHVSWNSRRGSSRKGEIMNELIFSMAPLQS